MIERYNAAMAERSDRDTHALFPGSFDPVTLGHLDVLERARRMFARVTLGVAAHPSKHTMFSVEQRIAMLESVTAAMPDVSTVAIDGVLVDAAIRIEAGFVVRGLRGSIDFEYERTMALTNRDLNPQHETVFVIPKPELAHISSTFVRQIAQLGGDVSSFVPLAVLEALASRAASDSAQS
ncbi:MAG: pantetheine-phosphate adenylyltransferase [Planctomycetota bacterium]|jgi:pantetheine-phosphate adenylyltransferase